LLSTIEGGNKDIGQYAKASDMLRLIVINKYGGIYQDLDYEIYQPDKVINYMKAFDLFLGFDNEYVAYIGNAFIASHKNHPVINKALELVQRNLNVKNDKQKKKVNYVPKYIREPCTRFSDIIFTTGPTVLTLSYYISANQGTYDLALPHGIIYNFQAAIGNTTDTSELIGNDMYSGSWIDSTAWTN